MTDLLQTALDAPELTPHGFCLAWDPVLLWLHVISDGVVAISYYSIPLALGYFVIRRRDLAFSWVFCLFAVFILACGTTHILDIWTLWNPDYGFQGAVKGVTAVTSVLTAGLLWPLVPKALALPSPAALQRANDRLSEEIEQRETAVRALQIETAERQHAQEMLQQSQKMEALGQLTGGVAHDFNNLLMVVRGNLDVMRLRARGDEKLDRYITNALRGVEQGKALTGQLLAFARRQPLAPVAFDFNERISGLNELLPATVGNAVRLELDLMAGLWAADADPNQSESALLNLVINARDAMPGGGTLTIKTCNVTLAHDADAAGKTEPGDYVALIVTDTGTGMSDGVRKLAFEPFFTTKPVGSGSGLGLSQIYGFVQQSCGYVTLESEPGRGTTVTILLRRAADEPARSDQAAAMPCRVHEQA